MRRCSVALAVFCNLKYVKMVVVSIDLEDQLQGLVWWYLQLAYTSSWGWIAHTSSQLHVHWPSHWKLEMGCSECVLPWK